MAGGRTSDGRQATTAVFRGTSAVALDAERNVYVAETYDYRVRRVSAASGLITTFAGNGREESSGDGGPATAAGVRAVELATDAAGNLYVADSVGYRVRKIDSGGLITTVVGVGVSRFAGDGGPATAASLEYPEDIAFGRQGDLFIADGNRVRRVDARTQIILTVAGNGAEGSTGDGGPATSAQIRPSGIAVDSRGDLFIAEQVSFRVRRVEAATGVITTYAGDGSGAFSGDGGPATEAGMQPAKLALDAADNLFISDESGYRIRRVDRATGVITTVAGNGDFNFAGESGPATAATFDPSDLTLDADGNLFISDYSGVRRVEAATGILRTVAGTVSDDAGGEDIPATSADVGQPTGVAVDAAGNLHVSDVSVSRIRMVDKLTGFIRTEAGGGNLTSDGAPATSARISPDRIAVDRDGNVYLTQFFSSRVRRVSAATGTIEAFAGGGSALGDGGPATAARLSQPDDVAVDAAGNVYIADGQGGRLRRVDARTGIITTVVGDGSFFHAGDGGPATAAGIDPRAVAVAPNGDLFIATYFGSRVRKVDAATGIISTVAGTGESGKSTGDGGPGTLAALYCPEGLALAPDGRVLYIAERCANKVRRLDLGTGVITSLAGTGQFGFAGDAGPASEATLYFPRSVAVDANGSVYVADERNQRIRAVFACKDRIGPFEPIVPLDGLMASAGSLNLSWSPSELAFRYDVLAGPEFPPRTPVMERLSGLNAQLPAGFLTPGVTYYWQVRARGDPYCPSPGERTSSVRRFTTPALCQAPQPVVLSPPAGPGTTTALSFTPSPGAAAYDLFLGPGRAPPLVAAGLTSPTYTATGLAPGVTYRWRVVAHAACDVERTGSSAEGSFQVPGICGPPGAVALSFPADGAAAVEADVLLEWQGVAGSALYDVYLSSGGPPALLAAGVSTTLLPLTLERGRTYSWRVVAHAACDATKTSSSSIQSFSTATACLPPQAPASVTAPANASVGSTYVLSWSAVRGAGSYRAERTNGADFSGSVEAFTTSGTSLVLSSAEKTTTFHRVTAIAACGASGTPSPVVPVTASEAPPAVVLIAPPRAAVLRQAPAGSPLPALPLELKNTGGRPFLGFLGTTTRSIPFFQLSESLVSLRPGESRILYARLTGVPPDRPGQYEGSVAITPADPSDTAAYPQASVSLTVTGTKPDDPAPVDTAPVFVVNGVPGEAAAFPPAPVGGTPQNLAVDIRNPGIAPLELGADAAPDPWVQLEPGWNSAPIAPGSGRTVQLERDRTRGEAGGAFPRTTYLTLRTAGGKSARLSLQDSDATSSGPCPGRAVLAPSESSLIVPSLVNASAKGGGRYVSKLLLTNLGPDTLQADLYYTPDTGDPGTSGLDCGKVLFASILVPGLDVIALTDPVGQLFGIADNSSGQLEIRSSRIGQLRVQSVVDAPAQGGGSYGFQLPTVRSGEGARQNAPYSVLGIQQDAIYRTNLILTETSGEPSSVTVTLYDKTGKPLGSTQRDLFPYGKKQFAVSDVAPSGTTLSAGALEITANAGSVGSVTGVITVIDGRTGDASSFLAKPLKNPTTSTSYAIPSVVVSNTFKSRVEIRNNDTKPVSYTLRYKGSTGNVTSAPRTLNPKAEDAWQSVLQEVFNLPPTSFGPLFIDSDSPNLSVVSRVYSEQPAGSYGDAIEGYALDDPTTTGESGRIVLTDGLEGTADNDKSRGARTNLIMAEIGGGSADLEVSIWEKTQRRVAPVGTITVHLGPNEQKQINDIFGNEGFGIGQKDRLNVLCTIRPKAGTTGKVIALATRIDNKTNDTKNLGLRP